MFKKARFDPVWSVRPDPAKIYNYCDSETRFQHYRIAYEYIKYVYAQTFK